MSKGAERLMKIRPRQKRLTRYSDEEKYSLFAERKIAVPLPRRNKKKYTRKVKNKNSFYED